jgi:hypothetical protein
MRALRVVTRLQQFATEALLVLKMMSYFLHTNMRKTDYTLLRVVCYIGRTEKQ